MHPLWFYLSQSLIAQIFCTLRQLVHKHIDRRAVSSISVTVSNRENTVWYIYMAPIQLSNKPGSKKTKTINGAYVFE